MAKKAATLRIHQLAKELGVDSKDIVAKCHAEEIPAIDNHMSIVSVGLAATIREWFSEATSSQGTAIETAAAVDVSKARAKARKKPARKAGSENDSTSDSDTATATAVISPEKPTKVVRPSTRKPAAPDQPDESELPTTRATPSEPHTPAELRPAASAPAVAPTPGKTEEPPSGGATAKRATKTQTPEPVMNVVNRPQVIPAGPMLQKPQQTKMAGPKIIRVEAAEVLPAPKPRTAAKSGPTPTRSGPFAGRGAGAGEGSDASGRTGGASRGGSWADTSRRNKRRSASAHEDGGRSARVNPEEDSDRGFNWRQQDLLERENRLNRAGGFFKAARRDNLKKATGGGHRAMLPSQTGGRIKVNAPISVKDLSAATGIKAGDIIKKLFLAGKTVTINSILNAETAAEAVLDYNIELEIVETKTAEAKIADQFRTRTATDERRRSPVVTILGHVDHGKTSLLDRIRNANVAAGEAGGITQATSAFQVPVHVGDVQHMVTFIDTPGHEAFTEMRARGAKVTDVVVLVVAADDGVMPQTVESINHARAANVPIVVALNKIDKPEATDSNIQRILGQLADKELNPSEWGGTTEVIRTSATKGTGIQDLLEVLDYQAQLLDLKADFGGRAEGTVLEARMEEGRGAVANVIVQHGTLKKGDFVAVGRAFGRVRDIINDHGQRIEVATPSMAVVFSGLNEVPDAGDKFYVVESLKDAEQAAGERQQIERHRDLAREKVTLDNVFAKLSESGRKELSLIVKADVQGSLETLRAVLGKVGTDEVVISLKHAAVGGVNESDVTLAEATGSIILAFNVTASVQARKFAEARGVDIRFYDVIYDLTDDVRKAAEGMLAPELRLEVLGHAEVREVFKISKVGWIAGCYVTDGVIERNSQIRVTRGGIVIEKDRRLQQLKRFKDDAKEVRAGQECGMNIDGYDDIKPGDVLECYKTREVARKL